MSSLSERILGILRDYKFSALVISATVLALKLMIINTPTPSKPPEECIYETDGCGFVFDEAHYIPAVRRLMQGEAVNNEHPPLSKALFILGILLFGDQPLGWRIFPAIAGAVSIFLVSLITYELVRRGAVATSAALLYAGDVMSFNLSSIAMLDSPAMAFLLGGTLLFIKERRVSGSLLLGLAALAKASTSLGIMAVLGFSSLKAASRHRSLSGKASAVASVLSLSFIIVGAVFIGGLAIYDYSLNAFPTPLAHLEYMLRYHSSLLFECSENFYPFYCINVDSDGKETVVDLPLRWTIPLSTFRPAPYYVVEISEGDVSYRPVAYYGIYSPLWWLTWVVLVFAALPASRALKRALLGEGPLKPGVDGYAELFVLTWVITNYFIYFPIAYLVNRWVYSFYFAQTVPMLAIATASMLWDGGLPRSVLYFMIAVQLTWLFVWFPVRSEPHLMILRSIGLPA